MPELVPEVQHLLRVAERDPDSAIARFDVLLAAHGRQALARALVAVAPDELQEIVAG
jgi:hypothetical protein